MSKNALIFTHESQSDIGLFADILQEQGFTLRNILTPKEGHEGVDPLAPDLLVVMGGPMGVYEADRYPFINKEIAIIEKRLAADKPMLGVCLGSQLTAAALGEKVFKGSQGPEFGWRDLTLTTAANDHPVKNLAGAMFHSHGDTYELPKGATRLASSAQYANQAYSYGKNAIALQCHPEVTAAILEQWTPPEEWVKSLSPGWTMDAQRRENAAKVAALNARTKLFVTSWLKSVGL